MDTHRVLPNPDPAPSWPKGLRLELLLVTTQFLLSACSLSQGIATTPAGRLTLDLPMENYTSYSGDTLRIQCDISGTPLPTYRWYKDGALISEIQKEDRRYNFKTTNWGSRLKVENARPSDSGIYVCMGSNAHGEEQTWGKVRVRSETNPSKPARDRDRSQPEDDDPHGSDSDPDIQFVENPDDPDSDSYHGTNIGPAIDMDEAFNTEDGKGFCQVYQGRGCSKFANNKNIFVKSKTQQGNVDDQLVVVMTIMGSEHASMSEKCSKYVFEGVCYYAIAMCDESSGKPLPRRLCQDECQILTTDYCKDEYQRALQNNFLGAQSLLPVCSKLPPRGTYLGDNCISIGIQVHTCYNDSGQTYLGAISRTVSGLECDLWANHYTDGEMENKYPELQGNHNHCRNPGNLHPLPWCYVRGQNGRQEMCDVPKCGGYPEAPNGLMYIVGPVIAIVCAVAIVMVIVCVCQRKKKKRNGEDKSVDGASPQQTEMNPMLKSAAPAARAKEFPMSAVRLIQELGEGSYGKVFKGELVGCYGDNTLTPVVIKVLRDGAPPKLQQDFRTEVETVADFKHPNIVLLLGVCSRPQSMLFEYLAHGVLHEYLIIHSPHSDVSVSDDDGMGRVLDQTDMLHISTQIAAGMEYLGLHQYIHKDLATRNILVGDGLNVKITDFGIGRSIYSTDYYRLQNQSQLPVRWMPPEAILYGKFGIESDVWSFGITMWEIYSYGLQPYYGYANTEVVEMIRSRQILPCPEECQPGMYSLMVECWHEVPGRRPCFKEIHQRLCQWQKEAHMMATGQMNPQLGLSLAASASGHSSSTHTSHSHPSHHSSAGGPSNNTTTTGITGSSNTPQQHNIPPNGYPPHNYGAAPPPGAPLYYNHLGGRMGPPPHYLPPGPIPNLPYSHRGSGNPALALYRKPSPPGSVSSHSHKSSSMHSDSPDPSLTNLKNQTSTPLSDKYIKLPSPTKPMATLANNKDLYIPDTRTSDI